MATPNYGYEKRQKELAKKRKKEDKLKAKAERKNGAGAASDVGDDDAPHNAPNDTRDGPPPATPSL